MDEDERKFEEGENRRQDAKENYAREKLWEAIGSLIKEGPLSNRISDTYIFIMGLTPQHFPDELIPKFLAVKAVSTKAHAAISGSISGNLISPQELQETAESILSLYVSLKGGITAKGV